jgi:hypothetical protein
VAFHYAPDVSLLPDGSADVTPVLNSLRLTRKLGVPPLSVVKALMAIGVSKTVSQPLSDREVELVGMQLEQGDAPKPDTRPPGSGADPMREPQRPRPSRPSAGAAATPPKED